MENEKLYYAAEEALAVNRVVFNTVTRKYLMESNVIWNFLELCIKQDIILLPYNLDCYEWVCAYVW